MVNGRNSRGNGRSHAFGGPVPLIGQPKSVEQRLKLEHLNTPNAFPVTQIVPEPDGAKLMLFGGLSKLEWMAGQVAAGERIGNGFEDDGDTFAIVDKAASILAECQERMNAAMVSGGDTEETTNGEVLT